MNCLRLKWILVSITVGIMVLGGVSAETSAQLVNIYIKGLAPDWNQPLDYPDTFDTSGPLAGDAFWNAWCAPTAAACLIAHWEDVNGRTGLADGFLNSNSSVPYVGPVYGANPTWHDRTADGWFLIPGFSLLGPNPLRGFRPVEDLGWYLDTNGAGMAGAPHVGTYYMDMAPGMTAFFIAVGNPAKALKAKTMGVDPIFGGRTVFQLASNLKKEVDNNRTALAHFRHWNLFLHGSSAGPGCGTETSEEEFDLETYLFMGFIPDGLHDEEWNDKEGEEGLGHTVLVVGYCKNVSGWVTHLIVHDNWSVSGRNVRVPVGPQLVAITTVNVQWNQNKGYELEEYDFEVHPEPEAQP